MLTIFVKHLSIMKSTPNTTKLCIVIISWHLQKDTKFSWILYRLHDDIRATKIHNKVFKLRNLNQLVFVLSDNNLWTGTQATKLKFNKIAYSFCNILQILCLLSFCNTTLSYPFVLFESYFLCSFSSLLPLSH